MDDTPRIALLGFTIPEVAFQRLLTEDAGMPSQTHKFAWSLSKALSAAGCQVNLISAVPCLNFPRNRRVWYRGRSFSADGLQGRTIGFVNLLILKHLTRIFSVLAVGIPLLLKWRSQVLLIHGVHAPFLWFALLARVVLKVTIIPVVTDPPGQVMPYDGAITRMLRRIDTTIVRSALRRADGVIALTKQLAVDFAPGIPCLVMEGILREPGPPKDLHEREVSTFDVVYAGGLSESYGVDRLVEAVLTLPHQDIRLMLFGRGELTAWIERKAATDSRIVGPSFISTDEVQQRLRQASALINPRPVEQAFTPYSFPSKLIEYLASGTPVVTTRLPGIPSDYDEHVFFIETDDVPGIASAIDSVINTPSDRLRVKSQAAAEFVQRTRSAESQGRRMRAFAEGLAIRTGGRAGWSQHIYEPDDR